ncbi:MAG TPA: response regulator transcription factor [Candidatus Dormibacteraeota bacterium]|nr:response regulator transcription factor [Candidatus Dormibacteraeota bacterium]
MNSKPRLLVVDDHEPVRRLVRTLLEAQEEWEVCGEAVNGQHALEQCELLQPNAIILDITMPVMNGFDVARHVVRKYPEISILFLTIDDSLHVARSAALCGAHGFLSKARASDHLVTAITSLLRGEKYFHTEHLQ